MSTQVDLPARAFEFSCAIVRLCRQLNKMTAVDRTLSRQILRAGTSVGANIEEAQAGYSRPDFINKMSIACKEARETHYWLRLLAATDCPKNIVLTDLLNEADQLVSILTAIVKNSRKAHQV